MKAKPLYQKIEDKYHRQESTTLQQRKQTLAEIRNLHKPVRDFDSHTERYA